MNKSLQYLLSQMTKKKYPTKVRTADWVHGGVVEVPDFVRRVYEDRGFDCNEEGFVEVNGHLLLFEKPYAIEREGKSFMIPVQILYNPEAKFNSLSITQTAGEKKNIDVITRLLYKVVTLEIPLTSGIKKIKDFSDQKIVIEVGDVVYSRELPGETKERPVANRYWAVPICCKAEKKEENCPIMQYQ